MVEPNLHGYYQVGEQRFLVKKGEGESSGLLLFFSFIYEPSSDLCAPPSLVLDRRAHEVRERVDVSSARPIHVYNESPRSRSASIDDEEALIGFGRSVDLYIFSQDDAWN